MKEGNIEKETTRQWTILDTVEDHVIDGINGVGGEVEIARLQKSKSNLLADLSDFRAEIYLFMTS